MSRKICLQSGNLPRQFGTEKAFSMIAEAGFEGIDLNLDQSAPGELIRGLKYEGNCVFEKGADEALKSYDGMLRAIRENGLMICQAHSVFPSYVAGHPEVIDWAVKVHSEAIRFCESVGCRSLVVHGIPLNRSDRQMTQRDADELNLLLYRPLIPALQSSPHVTVCMENLFTVNGGRYFEGACANPFKAVEYIDRLNAEAGREAFALCVDIGHLNLLGTDMTSYGPVVGSRIKALHINDNQGNADSHRAPFGGSVMWDKVIRVLREIDYAGDLSFETFAQTDVAFNFDPELVMPCLKLMAAQAEAFRRHLEA